MKQAFLTTIVLVSLLSINVKAQDKPEKLEVKLGGYIRTETLLDTRRSLETRDGESYYYPLKKGLDAAGKDTNQFNQFTMLGVQSRFKISGPK